VQTHNESIAVEGSTLEQGAGDGCGAAMIVTSDDAGKSAKPTIEDRALPLETTQKARVLGRAISGGEVRAAAKVE
jgi:hypothetical protein